MTSIFFVIVRIHDNQFKSNYLRKNLFLKFLFHFWNLHQSLNIWKQKIALIAYVFPKLETWGDAVRKISRKLRFRTLFNSGRAKGCQTLLKSAGQHFYHFLSSLWWKCCWTIPLVLILEISGLFVSTLTANDQYSLLRNREKLLQPIQIQLSKKPKKIFRILYIYIYIYIFIYIYIYTLMNRWTFTKETEILNLVEFITTIK